MLFVICLRTHTNCEINKVLKNGKYFSLKIIVFHMTGKVTETHKHVFEWHCP